MTVYDVGDIAVLSYVLTDSASSAYQPADPGGVVCRVYYPGGTLAVSYTWIAAGGGDAEIVNDSTGHFHVDYTVLRRGSRRYEFQAYSDLGGDLDAIPAANSIEREQGHFIGRA